MKYALPLGMVLLVGVAFGLRRSPSPAAAGERQAPARPEAVSEEPAIAEVRPASREAWEAPMPATSPRPVDVKPAAPAVGRPGWQKLVTLLEREIVLTSFQRGSVERILQERDQEIQACHQDLRKAGVIDIRRYEWQVDLMKENWYQKLDSLMDRGQHEILVALIHKGLLNEGLAFTVDPGMTVLD